MILFGSSLINDVNANNPTPLAIVATVLNKPAINPPIKEPIITAYKGRRYLNVIPNKAGSVAPPNRAVTPVVHAVERISLSFALNATPKPLDYNLQLLKQP